MNDLAKVSTKGQVVIPQELRDALGIKPGDRLQIERVGDLIVFRRVKFDGLKEALREATKR